MPSHKKNLTSDSSASKQSSYNIPKPKENRESKSHRKGSLTTQKPDYNYGSRGMKTRLKMYPKHITQIPSVQRIDEEPGSFQSSGSSNTNNTEISHSQDSTFGSILSLSSMSTSMGTMFSRTSLSTNVERFRSDFEEFKCKMVIFGESLSLCNCIASDFKKRLTFMERRLKGLEKEQTRIENNYFDIIQKNKKLTNKTKELVHKLQMCGTEEEMREVAGRICKNYLHGAWKTVEPADLDFRRISGGLSNFLYYVALPDDTSKMRGRTGSNTSVTDRQYSEIVGDEPKQVLLRIYGQVHGERAMDAIVTESVIFTLLSERRLGPKLHGVFSGGRIEEFIHARPLLTKELGEPAFSMKIAEKTAAIHSMEVPLSKEPYWMWKTMNKWLKTVKEERLANGVKGKNEEENEIIKRLKTIEFEKEIEWLKKFLATVDSPVVFCHNDLQEEFEKEIEWLKKFLATVDSPVVFCHNDLQEGNILLVEDEPTTTDEYETSFEQTFPSMTSPVTSQTHDVIGEAGGRSAHASLASIGVDDDRPSMPRTPFVQRSQPFIEHEDANTSDSIHSHISDSGEPRLVLIDFEYCAYNYRGFDIANHFQEWGYDYTNPDHPFYYENQENTPTLEQKEIFIKEYLKHYNANLSDDKEMVPPSIESVNKLLNEVEAFTLASHLFWTLWSIVNASKSQIPFGYWEYGISRLDNFLRLKQEIIKKDKCGLAQKRKICEVDI